MKSAVRFGRGCLWACPLLFVLPVCGATLDFESLPDLETVGTQFSHLGITFENAITLTAGVSLNEFEYPPRSGSVVLSDSAASLQMFFSVPVNMVAGYFTHSMGIRMEAYDVNGLMLALTESNFSCWANLAGDPSCPPNELLSVSSASSITRVRILGSEDGSTFALDDLTFSGIGTEVPEPSAFLLTGGLLVASAIRVAKSR